VFQEINLTESPRTLIGSLLFHQQQYDRAREVSTAIGEEIEEIICHYLHKVPTPFFFPFVPPW
jgi:hypothetical protein